MMSPVARVEPQSHLRNQQELHTSTVDTTMVNIKKIIYLQINFISMVIFTYKMIYNKKPHGTTFLTEN